MVIIGINAYHADSSAAIFIDGRMIAATEEERFTRVKHWAGWPARAIEFCLQEAGLSMEDLDYFAIGRDPNAKLLNKIAYLAKNPVGSFSAITERLGNRKKVSSIAEQLSAMSGIPKNKFSGKIKNIEHHRSHIASAFFASPFEEAACLSIDGSGDFSTTMMGQGKQNTITIYDSIDFPHSIGIFYSAFTQFLGFPHYGDEYKVMGMAPYGEPKYVVEIKELVDLKNDGSFRLDLSYFRKGTNGIISYGEDHIPRVATLYNENFEKKFGPARYPSENLTQAHKDLAASVQKVTEEIIFHLLHHLHQKTGLDKLCIAGGVAQNSVANGKITSNTAFKEVYIPSAGHDAGISMGAALYQQHQHLKMKREPIFSAYTGSAYSNDYVKKMLEERNISYQEKSDAEVYEIVCACLIEGGVVGWMNGRAEFGPRALGARSILADPRRQDAKEILNTKIKRRETFRPFAPSILKEYVSEYFEIDEPVPFMEKVFQIKKEKRALIPAVTHVDGSGRLQTVDKKVSKRYYELIDHFRSLTGIPILLNTSFNENEPIVNSPEEALACFLRTNMDMLVMENVIVKR